MKRTHRSVAVIAALLGLTIAPLAGAAETAPAAAGSGSPTYRLGIGDRVSVSVFNEDLNAEDTINSDGQIRLLLVGTVVLAGMSVRDAEDYIEKQYVEQKYLRRPMVTVRVLEYAPREALVNGAVGSPGAFKFQPEATQVDIVEVITKSGGFTEFAKKNDVRVTRITPQGPELLTIRVLDMMLAKTKERFFVRPGDIIFVDQTLL